jgi:hypothetical protein
MRAIRWNHPVIAKPEQAVGILGRDPIRVRDRNSADFRQ